jgi:uncharacterized UPF0160 family protein
MNKKILITHDGSFHADDIFAAATISLMLEKDNIPFEIIRTRDEAIIEKGDYVFDVGGFYDEEKNRFDHHQKGGAGIRANGIEYASFGLVWKKFGKEVCISEKVLNTVEEHIVLAIDAGDNGFDLVENKHSVSPYFIQHFFYSMRPTWRETTLSSDEMFFKCLEIAKVVLNREITQVNDALMAEDKVVSIYKNTEDKRIIILDNNYPYEDTLSNFPEPLYVIYPRTSDNFWGVKAMKKDTRTFDNRKDFPESWGGLRDEQLQKITGVEDAVFSHKNLFLVVAKTKEGAIKLAQLSLL